MCSASLSFFLDPSWRREVGEVSLQQCTRSVCVAARRRPGAQARVTCVLGPALGVSTRMCTMYCLPSGRECHGRSVKLDSAGNCSVDEQYAANREIVPLDTALESEPK